MIRPSSSSSRTHLYPCTFSHFLRSDVSRAPQNELSGVRVSGLSPPAAMVDQAQRARMARNREEALRRLHNSQAFIHKTERKVSRLWLKCGGSQPTSIPGVANVLYAQKDGFIPMKNLQETREMQTKYGLFSATGNLMHQNHVNDQGLVPSSSEITQEFDHMVGENVVTQEGQELESAPSTRTQEFDYVVVIDFEATCDKNMESLKPQEIIEFPSVLVDCRQLTLGDCFQTYVKPVQHPILTDFCIHLTGIQQEQVDKGVPLAEALYWHDRWLEDKGIKDKNFAVLIWSDWDCKIMLESECKLKGLNKPQYFNRWINLKVLFQNAFNGRKCNLRKAVEASGLKWKGRAHCGLDDAVNTARLALELMRRGTILTVTGSLDSEILVAKIRRPEWPGENLTASSGTSGGVHLLQSSNGTITRSVSIGMMNSMLCYCGVRCKRHMVKKPGPTCGKFFFACGRWTMADGSQCGFFEWEAC